MINIQRIKCGNGNCYIIKENEKTVLVDTARPKYRDMILSACRKENIQLLILTHTHMDHCQNAAFISEELGVPVAICKADEELIKNNMLQPLYAKIIGLAGHTNGSIGIDLAKKDVLVGDALMNMFYPTVSMLYHDYEQMLESARKIEKLGETVVYFGHGAPQQNRKWVR